MNDAAKITTLDRSDEARAFIEKAPHILALIRNRMLDVEATWQRHRTEIFHRFQDDLAALDAKHNEDVRRLTKMQRTVERMRQED